MTFFARILFAGLILFEMLNGFGILQVPLDFSWFGLIVTSATAWLIVEMLFGRMGHRNDRGIALMISFGSVILDAVGDVFHLYSRIAWYDRLLHVIGGAVAAYLICLLVRRYDGIKDAVLQWLFVVGVASLLGSLYEIEEWLEDVWVHGKMLRLGGGPDVADDMLMNIIGAIVVMGIITIHEKAKKKHT